MNKLKFVVLFDVLMTHPLKMASTTTQAAIRMHSKARSLEYQGGTKRFPVPDDKVEWSVDWPEYTPVDYTAPSVAKSPVWADPEIRFYSL